MNALRNVRLTAIALVLAAVAALSSAAPAHAAEGDTYAAIAYSPSSGNWGDTTSASSSLQAQAGALAVCGGDDARVVVVVKNGFAALAVSQDGSYGYAWGTSQEIAESIALAKCVQQGGGRARIVVSIGSDD